MPVTLDEVLSKFSPARRAEIERGGRKIAAQNRTLSELRKALNLTQKQVADALAVSQASVAEMESRDDMMVSTVSRVVEAMGGEVKLLAKLPGQPVVALKLGKKAGRSSRPGAAKKAAPARPRRPRKGTKVETRARQSRGR